MKGLVQMIFLFKGSDFMWFSGSKGVRFEFLQLLKSATRTDFSMGKSSDASHLWTRLRRVGLGNDDFLKTWEREPNREIAAFLLGAKDKDMKLSECISTAHLRWHLWSSFQADAGCFHHWPACHVHPGAQQFRDHVSNVFPVWMTRDMTLIRYRYIRGPPPVWWKSDLPSWHNVSQHQWILYKMAIWSPIRR